MRITNIYLLLSLNVIAVFIVVIAMSFVPGLFPDFFGDWLCEGRHTVNFKTTKGGSYELLGGCDYGSDDYKHTPEWHWGYQHWLWFTMGLTLFVIQVFRMVDLITRFKSEES